MSAATKIVMGVCGAICAIAVGWFVWSVVTRDNWEADNDTRISARLEEADRLQPSNPLAAYKTYDEVLKEAEHHKINSQQFAKKLADAEASRTALYPKVQDQIRAEEAEKQRQADEEARRAAAEKQRLAQAEEEKRAADEKSRAEQERQKTAIAAYRAVPQSARTALNAVKKLEARTEVGIGQKDYSTVVGEAWGDVKVFVELPDGKALPDLSFLLVSAMAKHKLALEIWEKKERILLFESEMQRLHFELHATEIPFFTQSLSGELLQRCWGAARRRTEVAASLLTADLAALARAAGLQKADASYDATLRSVLGDVEKLSNAVAGASNKDDAEYKGIYKGISPKHKAEFDSRAKELLHKLDDADSQDKEGR
ncbi:MAG: hypothetical protein ABSG68_07935 [Thermoguttaceae bacterium]